MCSPDGEAVVERQVANSEVVGAQARFLAVDAIFGWVEMKSSALGQVKAFDEIKGGIVDV